MIRKGNAMVGSLDISAGDGICKGVDHNQK